MFRAVRVGVFALVLLLSITCLALAAHVLHFTKSIVKSLAGIDVNLDASDHFMLFTASLSILVLIPMFVLGLLRKRAFTSKAWFELTSLSLLWIFWLALAASIASSGINTIPCDLFDTIGSFFDQVPHPFVKSAHQLAVVCREGKALEALSFINWILLMVYTAVVGFFAATAHTKGIKPFGLHSDELASRSYETRPSIPSPMSSPHTANRFTEADTKDPAFGQDPQLSYA